MERRRIGFWLVALIGLALIFQLFFRYQYLHLSGINVMRIDRLTLASCSMPCDPPVNYAPVLVPTTPTATPTVQLVPTPTCQTATNASAWTAALKTLPRSTPEQSDLVSGPAPLKHGLVAGPLPRRAPASWGTLGPPIKVTEQAPTRINTPKPSDAVPDTWGPPTKTAGYVDTSGWTTVTNPIKIGTRSMPDLVAGPAPEPCAGPSQGIGWGDLTLPSP